jgi:hypothetical protein
LAKQSKSPRQKTQTYGAVRDLHLNHIARLTDIGIREAGHSLGIVSTIKVKAHLQINEGKSATPTLTRQLTKPQASTGNIS